MSMSIEYAAKLHGVSPRRMQLLASQERILGPDGVPVQKLSGVWIIPEGFSVKAGGRTRPRPKRAKHRRRKP